MLLDEVLENYGCPILRKANKIKIPVHKLHISEEGAHQFNLIYRELLTRNYNKIIRTPSGGVSIAKGNFRPPMWDCSYTKACIEITIIGLGRMVRVQFRQVVNDLAETEEESKQTKDLNGRQAFVAFKALLKKSGIDLDEYAIDNGEEVKKTIPQYLIKATNKNNFDKVLENCHHIDFHNSFPAGLCNTHPEFRPVIEKLYEERKTKPINKAILNYSIGFFQSVKGCQARWAHLSRDAIVDNNNRIMDLCDKLVESNRKILLLNTDGIWYQGEVYHGEGEGKRLGEWENDHTNCILRIKSRGAYEFMENGEYHPVLRGYTKLDKVKPRYQWQWGDIYQEDADKLIQFFWTEEGLVDRENNLV